MKNILITGGAGFIGSNFLWEISQKAEVCENFNFIVIDSLSYAGNLENINRLIERSKNITFYNIDIRNPQKINYICQKYNFDSIINFAAESHVDNSIGNPNIFVETNILGTLNLLNASLSLYKKNQSFKYVQISTDEVYGSLNKEDPPFLENSLISPNSPYSASKASADHIVRSYFKTFNLPTVTTRCSNNYGPYQHPEKFLPVVINNLLQRKNIPLYGDGLNRRDWIHVIDHVEGIWAAYLYGCPGEVYNFCGTDGERSNLEIVKFILNELNLTEGYIDFVKDRPGHDFRYAINSKKAQEELHWSPKKELPAGLKETIHWYLSNQNWVESVLNTRGLNLGRFSPDLT